MMSAITAWWQGLSAREAWLVGIAGVLSAAIIGWFMVLTPLQSALASAREAYGVAIDRNAAINARVAQLRALDRATAPAAPAAVATVALSVTQAAAEAGLPLSRNDASGDRRSSIAIAAARAPAALAFIATLETMGILASDLSLRRNGDGTVALTATLERAP